MTAKQGAASGLILELRGITKAFGDLVANDNVDFDLGPSEIHVLLGENGAGKTTLMNVVFGHVLHDAGEIYVQGEPVDIRSPHDALEHRIGMVHQHFTLVPTFTVAQNVVMGIEPSTSLSFRNSTIESEVRNRSEELNMPLDPSALVRDLPVDLQQRVEILKVLYRGANVLILDEPTALLGPAQIANLLEILIDLRENGHSIILVTHKLAEVMEIADRVTVLRRGAKVLETARGEFDERSLARAMTGRNIESLPAVSEQPLERAQPLLEAKGLVMHSADGEQRNLLDELSFEVHAGEILGVAGVEGNGQRQLVEALTGLRPLVAGEAFLDGTEITISDPTVRRQIGLSVIPEDRHGLGLVLDMTLAENLVLTDVPAGKWARRGFVDWNDIYREAEKLLVEYDVRPPDPTAKAASLSGGNQQKVVLAREMSRQPRVLIADNPTWGLDVGAIDYVHRKLLDMRAQGGAVLLISLDLDELFDLADRMLVIYRGRKMLEAPTQRINHDDLALAMAGRAVG